MPPGTGGIDVTLSETVLSYQQMSVLLLEWSSFMFSQIQNFRQDIITILRCHHTECRVEMSQSRWLQRKLGQNRGNLAWVDMQPFSKKATDRLHAMSWIQKRILHHVRSTLNSKGHSSAERILICQLLVDLETSFSTSISDSEALYHQGNTFDASYGRNLADLLCASGDFNGALSLLHRIPLAYIREQDLIRMTQLGVTLCSRMMMIPKILGIDDDLMILDVFANLDVLILPHSLLAVYCRQWFNDGDFIKQSFMWPWIRRSIQARLKEQPGASGAPVDRRPTRLDPQFRDVFGHSFLHAAIFCQDIEYSRAIIQKCLEFDQEDVRASLSTAWPSYALGLTPLALSASSFAGRETFHTLLSFSGKAICCGSQSGAVSHNFCALACAIRNQDNAFVEALFQISSQQKVNITECCEWAMNSVIPAIPLEASSRLEETVRRYIEGSI